HATIAEADDVGHAVPVHVGKLARILVVVAPATRADTEVVELVSALRKVSAAGGKRDIDPAIAEADDVGHAVPVHVGEFARIQVVAAPTPGADSEVGKLVGGRPKLRRGMPEIAVLIVAGGTIIIA